MTKLYVGNLSSFHNFEFMFQYPQSNDKPKTNIPVQKVKLPHANGPISQAMVFEGTREDVDKIVAQHTPYGMVHIDDATKVAHIVNLVYSLDNPITSEQQVNLASEQSKELMNDNAAAMRERSTAASILKTREIARESNMRESAASISIEKLDAHGPSKTVQKFSTREAMQKGM